MGREIRRAAFAIALLVMGLPSAAQVTTNAPPAVPGAKPVTIQHIKVHTPSIEHNLEGETADRDVLVALPPSYAASPHRRYPVLYALHGYSIGAEQWTKEIHVPQAIEGAFAKGAREIIVVFPDSKTVHNGSMYSSSVTTGDFEPSSHAIWSTMSTPIIVRSRSGSAADSRATRWADMARPGSA